MHALSDSPDTQLLQPILKAAQQVIHGKPEALRLAICCLLARGHLLIEDQPGVGKTTLAHTLSRVLGMEHQRVQFTADLLPADLLGVSIYQREDGAFHFHPGPVFTQLLLADEINRATPKAQSALLEAMEEKQVTADGISHTLPKPFFVIATQNPSTQAGTYPLPESQLDRFLMRIQLGYPNLQAERELLAGSDPRERIDQLQPVIEPDQLLALQNAVSQIHVAEALLDYVQALLRFSRDSGQWLTGLSPRAGLALMRAARAWAMIDGRSHVLPDDVQAVLPAVANHRLIEQPGMNQQTSVQTLIEAVPVP